MRRLAAWCSSVPLAGRGCLAPDDDQVPGADLACVDFHPEEACGGQLAREVLGLAAGEAVGGVPAGTRPGEPLKQDQAPARGQDAHGLAEPGGQVVLVVDGADGPGHGGLAIWHWQLLGLALSPTDVARAAEPTDLPSDP